MKQRLNDSNDDRSGVRSIEYSIVVAIFSIAIVVGVGELGSDANAVLAAVKSVF